MINLNYKASLFNGFSLEYSLCRYKYITLIIKELKKINLSEKYIYNLYAICNHMGGVLGGHYTSFVKNANGKWYHFNDTNVSEITNLKDLITPKAYCLFYRKSTFGKG